MALVTTWLQDDVYAAAQDRYLIYAAAMGKNRVLDGLAVSPPQPGDPPFSVNVAEGSAVVTHADVSIPEATIVVNVAGSVNWELDPPPTGEQANVFVGIGAIWGSSLTGIGELSRAVGPIGHTTWLGTPVGSVVLAGVTLVHPIIGSGHITDARVITPMTGRVVGTDPTPERPVMPGGAYLRVS